MLGKIFVWGVLFGLAWIIAPYVFGGVIFSALWFLSIAWWQQGFVIVAASVIIPIIGAFLLVLLGRAGK